jgi:hypothetical protein
LIQEKTMADYCFVCFRAGTVELAQASEALASTGWPLQIERGRQWDNDCLFVGPAGVDESLYRLLSISYVSGEEVAIEAAEIAAENSHAQSLLPCDARFEIAIDDLDKALDEINTLIEVQSVLGDLTGGFVFNTWNGAFLDGE